MAASSEPLLITVEQYRDLPWRDDVFQELHWGRLVTMTRPKMKHARLQSRLVRLLRPIAEQFGVVESEVAFRALPEYDVRGADVAFVSQSRWDAASDDDYLRGAPEIVIEILSPSNTKAEMRSKAGLCLATEAEEFWIVDPEKGLVTVVLRDGRDLTYGAGDSIPLARFSAELAVAQIFSRS